MAAPFEVKVHDVHIADHEELAFEVETNLYRPKANESVNANVFQTRLELGYGLTNNSEIGINFYLSNYNGGNYFNGGKLSYLFAPSRDEGEFLNYGLKLEVNYINDIDGVQNNFHEITPIIALQHKSWRFTFNPSIDIAISNDKKTTFSPSAKVAYSLNNRAAVGLEYYVDNLPFDGSSGIHQQPNAAYLVTDYKYKKSSFNVGVGRGVATSTDAWVLKLIAALAFN